MATNSKLSAALRGNKNAAGPHKRITGALAKAGSKVGGAAESVKMQAKGAMAGAKAGRQVAKVQNTVKGVFGQSKAAQAGNTAKKMYQGAKIGRKAGAVAAKVSPMGEARGHMAGRELGIKIQRGSEKAASAIDAAKIKINKASTSAKSAVKSAVSTAKSKYNKMKTSKLNRKSIT